MPFLLDVMTGIRIRFHKIFVITVTHKYMSKCKYKIRYCFCILFISPPGTVVPGGLMFYCCFCLFSLFSGTLWRYISELPWPIAVKI